MSRFVFDFEEGNKDQKDLLGGKGANLAEMTNLGIPVPPGFTITTDACRTYLETGSEPEELAAEIEEHLQTLERKIGRTLGDPVDPLLVSVRSGAKFSMPGMMETVLNVGLNDESVHGLATHSDNERFAWDSYRRLIQMFGKTVLDLPGEHFEDAIDDVKSAKGVTNDLDLDADDLKELVDRFKKVIREDYGKDFPQDPREQMRQAVIAVFNSWNADRAVLYRRRERIPEDLGTAVNIVTMVFGNQGMTSGTGVAFTRDPATGAQRGLRRLPAERPGRGRRRGHPQHPVPGRPRGARQDVLRRAHGHHAPTRGALPRHVRHRVHRRTGQAVDAADPRRQAHRGGGVPDRHRPHRRRAHRRGRGAPAGDR